MNRRTFLKTCGTGFVVAATGRLVHAAEPLVDGIDHTVLWNGRRSGPSWFHPRACVLPQPAAVLMTLQSITGSDQFGPVHWTLTTDLGRTWSTPVPIPGLGRRDLADGLQEGVCDVVPQFHPPTGTVLAIGHNVYYLKNVLAKPAEDRWPVYVVRAGDGRWSAPQKLDWDDSRGSAIYTCGCGQRLVLANGDVLIPLSFGPRGRKDRAVATVRCLFDGHRLQIREIGNELRNTAGRGLLEPSVTRFAGRFFLTLRAEDGHGYVSVADDGLHWAEPKPWAWDDGEVLTMSTTQQHWLTHTDQLYLAYTRKTAENAGVFRYRTPLFMAAVDPARRCLMRTSEQILLPMVDDPAHAAGMGNFHPINTTPTESWVTVGEERSTDGWHGDTLLARIRWSKPNQTAL